MSHGPCHCWILDFLFFFVFLCLFCAVTQNPTWRTTNFSKSLSFPLEDICSCLGSRIFLKFVEELTASWLSLKVSAFQLKKCISESFWAVFFLLFHFIIRIQSEKGIWNLLKYLGNKLQLLVIDLVLIFSTLFIYLRRLKITNEKAFWETYGFWLNFRGTFY